MPLSEVARTTTPLMGVSPGPYRVSPSSQKTLPSIQVARADPARIRMPRIADAKVRTVGRTVGSLVTLDLRYGQEKSRTCDVLRTGCKSSSGLPTRTTTIRRRADADERPPQRTCALRFPTLLGCTIREGSGRQ